MRKLIMALAAAIAFGAPAWGAGEHRIGVGVHYWSGVDDLVDEGLPELDDDGVGAVVSWQYVTDWLFRGEIDVELHPDGYAGSDETTVAPSAFVILGTQGFYAGVGVGVAVSSGLEDDVSDPFYTGRIGLDLHPAPRLHVDLHVDYRVDVFSELEDPTLDGDLWTAGVMLRFTL